MDKEQIKEATKRCKLKCRFSPKCIKEMNHMTDIKVRLARAHGGTVEAEDVMDFGRESLYHVCRREVWHDDRHPCAGATTQTMTAGN